MQTLVVLCAPRRPPPHQPCGSLDAGECSCSGKPAGCPRLWLFGAKKGNSEAELGCVLAGVGAVGSLVSVGASTWGSMLCSVTPG